MIDIIQRTYELALDKNYRDVDQVEDALNREGYINAASFLNGAYIREKLNSIFHSKRSGAR